MNHINYFKNYLVKDNNLTSDNLGFLRGNMFEDLYKPYKNYQVKEVTITNEKDKLLYEISMYAFIMNDLALYLDTHPNDANVLEKFVEAKMRYCNLVNEYEKKYSALTLTSDSLNTTPWKWLNNWPNGVYN